MGPVAEWLRIAAAARTPEILAPCLYIGFVRRLLGGYGIGHVLRCSKNVALATRVMLAAKVMLAAPVGKGFKNTPLAPTKCLFGL